MKLITRLSAFLVLISICLSVCSCNNNPYPEEYSDTAFVFDTFITIRLYEYDGDAKEICDGAIKMLNDFENKLSATKPDSEISLLNRSGFDEEVVLDKEIYNLLKVCGDMAQLTDGAFDYTLGRVSDAWGFGSDNAVKPDTDKLKEMAGKRNYKNILFNDENCSVKFSTDDFSVDLGAAAKGYAMDYLYKLLTMSEVKTAVIDFGGSILTIGEYNGGNWNISVSGMDNNTVVGTLNIPQCFIATSNGFNRYVEYDGIKYHHIINPETAFPAESDIMSVTVVSGSGILSDALSTAIYVMGNDAEGFYTEYPLAEYIIVYKDGTVSVTDGLKESFAKS